MASPTPIARTREQKKNAGNTRRGGPRFDSRAFRQCTSLPFLLLLRADGLALIMLIYLSTCLIGYATTGSDRGQAPLL